MEHISVQIDLISVFSDFSQKMSHGIFHRTSPSGKSFNVSYELGKEDEVNKNRKFILDVLERNVSTWSDEPSHSYASGMRGEFHVNVRQESQTLISAVQVHGTRVQVISEPHIIRCKNDEIPDTDAFITNRPDIFLMVKTADCQPILVYDPVKNVIANVHSGWRGNIQNIIGVTLEKMISEFGSHPSNLRVGIGPSLGPCCSEFTEREKDFVGFERYFLPDHRVDLWAITRDQLLEKGVLDDHIEFSKICTCCNVDTFFSYRAEKPDKGRFATVIGLKKVPKIDFAVGGQAVIEGVMMRSPRYIAIAIRKADGSIKVKTDRFKSLANVLPFFKWPILRGMLGLVEMMIVGMKALNFSANENLADIEAAEKAKKAKSAKEKEREYCGERKTVISSEMAANEAHASSKQASGVKEMLFFTGTIIFSLIFGIFLFKFLPLWITQILSDRFVMISENFFLFNIIDGVIKTSFFIIYVGVISLLPDIQRVFEYHGAEHKSVFTYEHDRAFTPKNAMKESRFHPRCGTSFVLVVFMISILVYTLLPNHPVFLVKFLQRLAILPIIAGISYEFLKLSARYADRFWVRVLIAPGLMFQKMTTREPNEKQLEVGLKALEAVLDLEKNTSKS